MFELNQLYLALVYFNKHSSTKLLTHAMATYQHALSLLSDAFLAQIARRNTVSVGIEPEESLFCDFVITAFEVDYPNWEKDLIELLTKCHATQRQQQRILDQAQGLHTALSS